MIWAHAFLLSDKIPSLSRCLFLLASVRQPYKSPAVGRYGDLKFQAFTAALPPAGDLSIIQSCMPALSRKIQRSGNTVQICCICFLSRTKKRGKLNFPMCKEEQAWAKKLLFRCFASKTIKHISLWRANRRQNCFASMAYLTDYLNEFYDVLHTTGYQYINHDIDIYLKSQNAVITA